MVGPNEPIVALTRPWLAISSSLSTGSRHSKRNDVTQMIQPDWSLNLSNV